MSLLIIYIIKYRHINDGKLGFNVVYYTLELGEVYVGKRFDAFFVNEPVNQIHLHRKKTETEINRLEGKLVVKEFSKQ